MLNMLNTVKKHSTHIFALYCMDNIQQDNDLFLTDLW